MYVLEILKYELIAWLWFVHFLFINACVKLCVKKTHNYWFNHLDKYSDFSLRFSAKYCVPKTNGHACLVRSLQCQCMPTF